MKKLLEGSFLIILFASVFIISGCGCKIQGMFKMKLSTKRANAVMEYLASKCIDKSRLSARGFGKTKPAESNDTEEGRKANRRVEISPLR